MSENIVGSFTSVWSRKQIRSIDFNYSHFNSIGAFNLLAYPTPTGDSYSCDYAAEVQLNNTNNAEYGFIIKPAMWQGYSTFSPNQTTISNPDECDFDKVPDNSEREFDNVVNGCKTFSL